MQFIVIAYDGVDSKAEERRLTARDAHLKLAKEMFEKGKWLYAVGVLNDDEKTIGSMVVCDFPSREELEKQWLKNEPYVTGNVWEKVEVNRAFIAPFCTNWSKQ